MLTASAELVGAAARRKRPREAVRDQVQPRLDHAGPQREPLDRRVERRRLAGKQLPRPDHPHRDPVGVPVRADAEQQAAEDEDRCDPVAAQPPAERPERRRADAEQDAHALRRCGSPARRPRIYPRRRSRSSSASPRGGQSGSGASQRLEQWREAMFWSGIRMCPFSSMCATSST